MDRNALIAAIRAHPGEDTPRLMFADWLEEFGTGDRDAATVEFIRASCSMRTGGSSRMRQTGYTWLRSNWKRLVPDTLALHQPWTGGTIVPIPGHSRITVGAGMKDPIHTVKGRKVWMRIALLGGRRSWGRPAEPPNRVYDCSAVLTFWKGFCVDLDAFSDFTFVKLRPVLEVEQPLTVRTPVPTPADETL